MKQSEVLVSSVSEFLDAIELYYRNRSEDFHSPEIAGITYFRGHSDASYELSPSLYRKFRGPAGQELSLYSSEQAMIHDAIQLNPSEFQQSSAFEVLCKLQHFGLPTRLLDVSSNPLVALYFATAGGSETTGEVILVPPLPSFPSDNRTVLILSEFALRGSWEHFSPENFADDLTARNGQYQYTVDEIERALTIPWTLVKPYYTNPRLRMQQGAFMLFGAEIVEKAVPANRRKPYRPAKVNKQALVKVQQELFQTEKSTVGRLLIPGKSKHSIRKQLDRLGVNRSTLFPEIEHQLGYIIEAYRAGHRGSEFGWENQFRLDTELDGPFT